MVRQAAPTETPAWPPRSASTLEPGPGAPHYCDVLPLPLLLCPQNGSLLRGFSKGG